MDALTWLKVCAIGGPLLGALVLHFRKNAAARTQQRLATILFGATAVCAFALFILNQYYACSLIAGPKNCLYDGAATITLALLSLVLLWQTFSIRDTELRLELILRLLFVTAWAAMGLTENLLGLFLGLYLFGYVLYRWFKKHGLQWGIFVVWPDDKDKQ